MLNDGKGYLIPDTAEPPGMQCAKIYIPDDPLYVGAFWAAYEFFTTWLAWTKEPLRRGRLAARAWRKAFDRARQDYENMKGVCEMAVTNVRQNPLNPCTIEVEFDGNNQWVAVADLGLCGGGVAGSPTLRFNGTSIQRFDPCSGEWVDIGQPLSPATLPVPVPLPEAPGDGACRAASAWAGQAQSTKNKMCSIFAEITTIGEFVVAFINLTFTYFGVNLLIDTFATVIAAEYAEWSAHFEDALAIEIAPTLACITLPYFSDDGTMTEANYVAADAAILAKVDTYSDGTAEHVAYGMAYSWFHTAGRAGVAKGVMANLPETADCSACGWTAIHNFTDFENGWFSGLVNPGFVGGHYVPSVGFVEGLGENAGNSYTRTDIRRAFRPGTITEISVYFDAHPGTCGLDGCHLAIYHPDNGDTLDLEVALVDGDNQVEVWTGEITTDALYVFLQTGAMAGSGDPGGHGTIRKIILRGTGDNPFA